jgi:hypothetical protein
VTETTLPEGWYRDPSLPATRRWWDGSAWTDHVRPDEDAALGLGALRRSASSASVGSVEPPAVSEATTFAVPSEIEGTRPVSSVGSVGSAAAAGSAATGSAVGWGVAGSTAAGARVAGSPAGAESSGPESSGAESSEGGAWHADTPPWAQAHVTAPAGGSFAAPSSVAELESVDYAPMENSWGSSATSATVRRTPAATGTAGAWLLAMSPLLTLLFVVGVGALVLADPVSSVAAVAAWLVTGLSLVWLVLAVLADFRRLGALGYTSRPSVFWIILGPLPYLISRTVHVHRATGHGSAPLWAYLVVSLLVGAAGAAIVLWASSGALVLPEGVGGFGL